MWVQAAIPTTAVPTTAIPTANVPTSQNSGVRTKSTLRGQGELEAQRAKPGRGSWGVVVNPHPPSWGSGSAVSYPSGIKGSFLLGAKPRPT